MLSGDNELLGDLSGGKGEALSTIWVSLRCSASAQMDIGNENML